VIEKTLKSRAITTFISSMFLLILSMFCAFCEIWVKPGEYLGITVFLMFLSGFFLSLYFMFYSFIPSIINSMKKEEYKLMYTHDHYSYRIGCKEFLKHFNETKGLIRERVNVSVVKDKNGISQINLS
jgi:hypothetical protein